MRDQTRLAGAADRPLHRRADGGDRSVDLPAVGAELVLPQRRDACGCGRPARAGLPRDVGHRSPGCRPRGTRGRPMKHLIISREYPPAPYPPGGIGTYVANIARLMAEAGEIVHLIGQRWEGAPEACEVTHGGRLIIHRIGELDLPPTDGGGQAPRRLRELEGLKNTVFPNQWFAWHAALLAEKLIDGGDVDVVEGQE